MKAMQSIAAMAGLVLILAGPAAGGQLEKRHQLELKLGMWNQTTDVRTEIHGGVSTSVGNNGFLGGISFGHWLSEGLALCIGVGAMAVDVDTDVDLATVSTETHAVTTIMMSMKQYFPKSAFGSSARPFVQIGAGPFIGSQSRTETGQTVVVESRTETALGGRIGAGADFILGRHFMTGVSFGYNLMTDFDEPIGGSRNYSGPEFAFSFSYLFGKGVDLAGIFSE